MDTYLQQTTSMNYATGQYKAKPWFAVNFGKVKLTAMTMVNLAREIA